MHFKPSGKVQLLEAQLIKSREKGEEVFEEMPQAQTEAEFIGSVAQASGKKDWLSDIWNKWPGDESVEELQAGAKGEG